MARLAPEILSLLGTSLGSFEKLELVSYLSRTGAPVPRAALQAALQLETDSMREVTADLLAASIIELGGPPEHQVRLGPRAQADDFRSLMALYTEDRLSVVAALASAAVNRIRTMAARTFAEAFVLQKKYRKDDDG